jgi:molybdenum cofactor cytidylyltransferase
MQPTVLVLAAGQGSRFKASGGVCDKLNAPLHGQRVRDHVLAAVQASGLPYFVVEREHLADKPQAGMGDSIAYGVAATLNASGWLVLPADLPLISPHTLHAVARTLAGQRVVVPFHQSQRGHPVGFSAECRADLLSLTGDEGARAVVSRHGFKRLDVDDLGAVLDVDTVDALSQAERCLSQTRIN